MSISHKALSLNKKFSSFGWEPITSMGTILVKFTNAFKKTNKPKVIICKTIKGKGVSFMENIPIWHWISK